MDLSTTYLGLKLPHPLIPGASPLADELDRVQELEDAGAPMIVLRSLFEEQLVHEQLSAHGEIDAHENASPEALSYFGYAERRCPSDDPPNGLPNVGRPHEQGATMQDLNR